MSIKKQKGRWLVAVRPSGKYGPFIRRIVNTRSEAVRLERELLGQNVASMDNAKVSDCVQVWFDHWGINLKDGKRRKNKLDMIVDGMGDRRVSTLKGSHYLAFRKHRLDKGIAPNTCNHELAYLKAVFSRLMRSGQLSSNPVAAIPLLKIDEIELSYLTRYQILKLLVAANKSRNESLPLVIRLCLATGARWSEAEQLTFNQLQWNAVTFTKTKSGKIRRVPIDTRLFDVLNARRKLGQKRVFANCLSAFRSAISRAKIELPKGQMSHVLRHTFASHFVMNGGDILTLQKVLGHSDIKVTMRYAHLAPEHLMDAVKYNPLSRS